MESIKLIEPTIEYKAQLIEYVDEFLNDNETIHGGADIQYANSIEEWVEFVKNNKNEETVYKKLVPASTFLLIREEDNKLLGLLNIRHRLNNFLFKRGGNISYSIKKSERQKGYGYKILKLAIVEAKKINIDKLLITCNDDNIPSQKIIEKNNGVLENIIEIKNEKKRRYWIDLSEVDNGNNNKNKNKI